MITATTQAQPGSVWSEMSLPDDPPAVAAGSDCSAFWDGCCVGTSLGRGAVGAALGALPTPGFAYAGSGPVWTWGVGSNRTHPTVGK
jgi:hypothetical protein